jgi:hypothetical protein
MVEELLKVMDILASQERIQKLLKEYQYARPLRKYEIWGILNRLEIEVENK